MSKLKALKELYSATNSISEPEITPVLRGSCRMRGPVGDTDNDTWTNTVLSRAGNGSGCHSMNQKVHMRAESGTCNVCSAPCSSCMHFNRSLMGSKVDEFRDETCHREADSQYSVNEGDSLPPMKSRACDKLQHTASETSNILSVTSSHDSFSENVESKANLRSSDIYFASEGFEMCRNSKSQDAPVLVGLSKKCRGIEGHDDNTSCGSGANDANILVKYDNMSVDRNNVLCSSASVSNLGPVALGKEIYSQTGSGNLDLNYDVEESHCNRRRQSRHIDDSKQLHPIDLLTAQVSNKFDLSNFPVQKDRDASSSSPKLQSPNSHSGEKNSPPGNMGLKDLDEDLSFLCQRELPDSIEPMDSSLTREAASNILSCQKSQAAVLLHNTKGSLIRGSSEVCGRTSLESEAEIDKDSGYLQNDALRCSGQNKQAKKLDVAELCDMLEPPLQSISGDDSDDSDIVEHDVKVCDICGDAGREDLLAVCSRCSDGAEHTYCMQEMLDKVPEDEWLCDECKLNEESEKQKQDRADIVNEKETKQCPGHTSSAQTDHLVKLDTKDSDVEANRTKKVSPTTHVSRKRPSDNIDADSAVKRQALETSTGSPKVYSPSRTTALSRDSSFKNLDKGKVKLAHQMSFGTSTTSPRLETARGNLLKSNSFSSLNNKPKVKPAHDGIPHKLKGAGSLEPKEGPLKMMSKSISFKSANSARSSAPESKVKMLSPRFPHFQDIRGLRKSKERNTFERKNLSKSDAPMVSLATASSTVSALKGDQKLTSRGESILHPSASNFRDSNPGQTDGKFASSKPIGILARKALELPGEDKRHSFSLNAFGASLSNGMCSSSEEKPNLVSPKEEPSASSSQITERPSINANDTEEGLPLSQDSTNQAERTGENLIRSRQGVTSGGRGVPCQRCNDTGHATHLCTITSPRASSVDASAARSSVDAVNKGNKLKAAIHAAMLKKPGMYKKSKVPDQSDELSLSSTDLNFEVASQEQLSVSSHFRSTIAGKQDGQSIFVGNISDSCKQTNNNVKQVTMHPTESIYSFRTWDSDAVIPSDGKPIMGEFPSHASAMMSVFLQTSAIPEHEYIWQGDFEVHRTGRVPELCFGIQAHLSTCASPKVIDVVNKFACRVPLTEVSRLSTWPTQFDDCGPTEDHIALYFFAKDVESYERNYRSLLESMMKNDVALKGSIDGVELLIFPSNQLPKKSQRWNMLFFLWGVFRARRVNCSEHMPNPSKKLNVSSLNVVTLDKDYRSAVLSFPGNLCSSRRTVEESSGCERICSSVLNSNTLASFKVPTLPSPEAINGTHDSKPSCLEEANGEDCKLDMELQSHIKASSFYRSVEMSTHHGILNDRQETLSPVKIHSDSSQDADSIVRLGSKKILDRLNGTDQVKIEKNVKDEEGLDMEISPERDTRMRDSSRKESRSWQLNHMKRPHFDLLEITSQASSSCTNEEMLQNDARNLLAGGENIIKKLKTESNGVYGNDSWMNRNPIRDDIVSETHNSGLIFSGKQKCGEAWDERKTTEDPGYSERHFFPVVPRPVIGYQVGDSSIPWKSISSDNEVWLHAGVSNLHHDDVPNLDLALGAETKPPKQEILPLPEQGILPFFVGAVDTKNDMERPPATFTPKEEDDDATASLSLSLSFPFGEKERLVNAAPKPEPILSERRNVNTPFRLFKGFPDK